MITDGERLKKLLLDAQNSVLLCAPFIKYKVLESLLQAISPKVSVKVVTRWRAPEVAAGVSDLEVFEVVNRRPNTSLALINELHAKLYVADNKCLLGSANLTGSALGWSKNPNVELLIESTINTPEVSWLIKRVETADQATYSKRESIANEVAQIGQVLALGEGEDIFEKDILTTWLPQCATPSKLFVVYENEKTMSVIQEAKDNAKSDLSDLLVPSGLNLQDFDVYIRDSLRNLPIIFEILQQVSFKINDEGGIKIVKQARGDLTEALAVRQWQILRDWLVHFFCDELEIAAESFVLRPKK